MFYEPVKILLSAHPSRDLSPIKKSLLKALPNVLFIVARDREQFLERITWNYYDLLLIDCRMSAAFREELLLITKTNYPHLSYLYISNQEGSQLVLKSCGGEVINLSSDSWINRQAGKLKSAIQRNRTEQEVMFDRMAQDTIDQLSVQKARELNRRTMRVEGQHNSITSARSGTFWRSIMLTSQKEVPNFPNCNIDNWLKSSAYSFESQALAN